MKKQLSLFKNPSLSHGGELVAGKRKEARPLVTKSPMHVVLKSSRAKGEWSFLKNKDQVKRLVYGNAERLGVKIRLFQNVGNHLHIAIQARRRKELQDFLRTMPQLLVYAITGCRRGNPIGKFWDHPVFTRVVQWGRDWANLQRYFEKNFWQAKGVPREVVEGWAGFG